MSVASQQHAGVELIAFQGFVMWTHPAAGLAAADGGGEGTGRGLAAPPPGKPRDGLAPGMGAAGLGTCENSSSWEAEDGFTITHGLYNCMQRDIHESPWVCSRS